MRLIGFLRSPDGLMAIVNSSDALSPIFGDLGCYDLARHEERGRSEDTQAINKAFRSVFGEDMNIPTNPIVPPLEQLWLMADQLGWSREEAATKIQEATDTFPVEPWDGESGHSYISARERLLRRARRESRTRN